RILPRVIQAHLPHRRLCVCRPALTCGRLFFFRNQHPELPLRGFGAESRSVTLESEQAAVKSELRRLGARDVKGFHLLNAVAATVSKAEAERLAAWPECLGVVPDIPILLPNHSSKPATQVAINNSAVVASPSLSATLEPEALQVTNAEFQPG